MRHFAIHEKGFLLKRIPLRWKKTMKEDFVPLKIDQNAKGEKWNIFSFFKNGQFTASFYLFSSFQYSLQLTLNVNFAVDWIQTADL